jgi:hypothetical protein
MKCFYHSADLDGKCSGAVVKFHYPECEMIGINYGQPFPWGLIEKNEVVWMVDFSLQPFSDMVRLNEFAILNWIDHHQTSIDAAEEAGFTSTGLQILEIGRAACELTWGVCSNTEVPPAVFLLGRYDIWDHQNHPPALEFQYGMRACDADPNDTFFWKSIFFESIEKEIALGRHLLSYEERSNALYVKSCGFVTELDGLRAIAVNKALSNSLLFKSIYNPEEHDVMVAFARRPDRWTVSVYSAKADIDASAICKARGGGGHKGAAAFACDTLPFG